MSFSPIDRLFSEYIGNVPGVSALMVENGIARTTVAFGMANLAQNIPATPATNYRLASVSKQFAAMGVLLLVADGRLALEDSLAHFFTGAPAFWKEVTIWQLLTHTAGLLDYEDLIPPGQSTQVRDEDVLAFVLPQARGYHAPGTAFRYSNTGYCLLALLIEKITDRSYAQFLRERIFEPLEMSGTRAHEPGGDPIPHRAFGYSRTGKNWDLTDQNLTSATLGDGGIYSSVIDLARWDAALTRGSLLSAQFQRMMFAEQVHVSDGVAYGLGWYLRPSACAYHTGETIGFRNAIVRCMESKRTGIVLMNRNDAPALTIAESLIGRAQHPSSGYAASL